VVLFARREISFQNLDNVKRRQSPIFSLVTEKLKAFFLLLAGSTRTRKPKGRASVITTINITKVRVMLCGLTAGA
jgi:hypothetical protein